MRICFPIVEDKGLSSEISGHFGSAPCFQIVDLESGDIQAIPNQNAAHVHGHCNPLASLRDAALQAVVVSGIGRGALNRLQAAGIAVYRTDARHVGDAVSALQGGLLPFLQPREACAHGGSECDHP